MKNESYEAVESITPEMAIEYLSKNIDGRYANRSITRSDVIKYANEMKAGNWRVDVNPIIFDKKGRMIDGQHRLEAILEAEIAVNMLVKRGVAEDSFKVIDTGHIRDAVAFATIERHECPKDAVPLFRWLQNLSITKIPTLNPTQEHKRSEYELQDWGYITHPKVIAAIKAVKQMDKVNRVPDRVLQFCYYMFAKHDENLAFEYLQYLVQMDGIAPFQTCAYVKQHIMGYIQTARENKTYSRDFNEHLLVWIIAGWNAIREGRTDLTKFKTLPEVDREHFQIA